MRDHGTEYILKAKALLPDDVFSRMLVELQHWFTHHEMNVRQIKAMLDHELRAVQ